MLIKRRLFDERRVTEAQTKLHIAKDKYKQLSISETKRTPNEWRNEKQVSGLFPRIQTYKKEPTIMLTS